jgi:branched-chain amino acid transport system ATP-binding protein
MLDVSGLGMRFGGNHALRGVSACIAEGTLVGLIGPNGAGKSTFVNCVTGNSRPTAGSVRWSGTELSRLAPERIAALGVARTFQHARLFAGFSVLENVTLGTHRHGSAGMLGSIVRSRRSRRDEAHAHELALEALSFVGIGGLSDAAVDDLTAGQQRLVALARALAAQPSFLLLDEPAAGLTDTERDTLLRDLQRYFAERRITGLVIEHHLGFLMELVSDVIVLVQGAVLTRGTPDAVRADPAVIEAYIGG